MSETGPDFRKRRIDYSNFPRETAYVSVGDVDAAYKQGLRDGSGPIEARNRRLVAQLATAEATIAGMQRALHEELAETAATTPASDTQTPEDNVTARPALELVSSSDEIDQPQADTVESLPVSVPSVITAWTGREDWA